MRPVLILLFCLAAWLPLPSMAAGTGQVPEALHYEVYAGGIHALSADLTILHDPDNYHVMLKARPYGIIGNLLPWGGVYETKGVIVRGIYQPLTFDKTSQWHEDNDSDSFVYKNGALISQTETDETKKPVTAKTIPLDPALTADSVDILTGTMQLLSQLDAGKSCDFSTIIYDGKRRYTLQFRSKGTEKLVTSDYNSFTGDTKICEIEMIPIANFPKKSRGYYKIQEEARARGQLPTVWIGKIADHYEPVKVMVKSEMGAVLIHLQQPK